MVLKDFFLIIGTSAFFAGYPTGISNVAFSFLGRSNIFSKNPIGDGVGSMLQAQKNEEPLVKSQLLYQPIHSHSNFSFAKGHLGHSVF